MVLANISQKEVKVHNNISMRGVIAMVKISKG